MSPVLKRKEAKAQELRPVITLMPDTAIDSFHRAAENMRTHPENYYRTSQEADSAAMIAARVAPLHLTPGVIPSRFATLLEELG